MFAEWYYFLLYGIKWILQRRKSLLFIGFYREKLLIFIAFMVMIKGWCIFCYNWVKKVGTASKGLMEDSGGNRMINFDEEIQKFQPSLDVDQAEDAIQNNDLTDISDILKELLKSKREN
jgi:hypothetical protein